MNPGPYIARHMTSGGSVQRLVGRIAVVAVTLSVASLTLTSAVVHGFRKEVGALVGGLSSDVIVTSPSSLHSSVANPIEDSPRLVELLGEIPGVTSVSRYVLVPAVIRSEFASHSIALKGVDSDYDLSVFESRLVDGAMPDLVSRGRREILLSDAAGKMLGVGVGDKVEIVTMDDEMAIDHTVFKVCGLSSISIDDTSAGVAITSIRFLQKINRWDADCITGYALRTDGADHRDVAADVNAMLLYRYEEDVAASAFASEDLYQNIYSWMATHDVNARVIMTIMFIVALINMLTILLISIIDRTRMIGVLRCMGMRLGSLRRIFLLRSMSIVFRGLVYGNLIAALVVWVQDTFHPLRLEQTAYFVPYLPLSIEWTEVLELNIAFIVLLLLAVYAATTVVGHVRPAEAVKLE